MRPLVLLARILFALGAALLLAAVGLLVAAGSGGPEPTGWEGLARTAGALLLATAGAFAMGGALLAWARARLQPPAWQRGTAMAGAALGLVAAFMVGSVALGGGSVWLLLAMALVVLVAGGGLVATMRADTAT